MADKGKTTLYHCEVRTNEVKYKPACGYRIGALWAGWLGIGEQFMKWNGDTKSSCTATALLLLIMIILTGDSVYSKEDIQYNMFQIDELPQEKTLPQESLQEPSIEEEQQESPRPEPMPQEPQITKTQPDDNTEEPSTETTSQSDIEKQEEPQTNPLVMTKKEIEKELLRIRAVWTESRNGVDNGIFPESPIPGGGRAFFDENKLLDTIQVSRKTDFVKRSSRDSYTRIFQFENEELIFAFYTEGKGGVAYRLYFKDGWLFRLRYAPNATVNGNYTDFDLRTDMEDYNTWQDFALNEANELSAMVTR